MSNATLFKSSLDASAGGAFGGAGGSDAMLLTTSPNISTIINRSNLKPTTPLNAPQLEVVPTYNDPPMMGNEVSTTALSGMGPAGGKGPERACLGDQKDEVDVMLIFDTPGRST